MKTVRRLFYVDIVSAVAFAAIAFLSLSFFIDFVDELSALTPRYTALHAALYALLLAPGHFYEVAPIAVLIGTIYTLSQMAQSSEFTILRTGGLGPGRALSLLASLGLVFGVLTFVAGDYVAPASERQASRLKAIYKSAGKTPGAGAWVKDHVETPDGERSYSINIASVGSGNLLQGVRIFEFDTDGRLLRRIGAASARIQNQLWTMKDVSITRWVDPGNANAEAPEQRLPEFEWQSNVSPAVVEAAVSSAETMSTFDLARYIVHLSDNEQAAQQQRIQFWKRALYPFACLVMVALALPFAYLHARAGGVSLKVFGGIMLGISFVLLNNLAGHLGLLREWTPWIVAAAPGALYLLLSLAAFSWLVRYR